jgi:DNA-binding transcriptional LysR family regulator
MVREDSLHMAVSASTGEVSDALVEYPLARDPFIMVVPSDSTAAAEVLLSGSEDLPFLRYAADQLIARQIEDILKSRSAQLPARFEIGSHLALIAMVARGIGWTVTTPLGYMRAARFHDRITAHPMPGDPAARQISLYTGADWKGDVPNDIAAAVRGLIERRMIAPAREQMPWLDGQFHLL